MLATFILCALVFALDSEKAQAQPLPQDEQQQHAVLDEEAAGKKTAKTPVETAPFEETSRREARQEKTPPVETAPSPVPASGLPDGQPARPDPVPATVEPELSIEPTLPADAGPVPGPALQPQPDSQPVPAPTGPEISVDPTLASPASGSSVPEPGPVLPEEDAGPRLAPPVEQGTARGPVDPDHSPLALGHEQVNIEEGNALSSLVGEEPAVAGSEDQGSYPLSTLETSVSGAVEILEETLEDATANSSLEALVDEALSWPLTAEGEGLIDAAWASLFAGGETGGSFGGGAVEETGSTSAGPEGPLKDATPQPVSPFAPPAGSYFSISGGQIGASGVVLLLLCVLASGLILPRRDFKLSWNFCELPKPSSALRLPLERPG